MTKYENTTFELIADGRKLKGITITQAVRVSEKLPVANASEAHRRKWNRHLAPLRVTAIPAS